MAEQMRDFLKQYFQDVIDDITGNLHVMRDSRGNNRLASGTGLSQSVGAYNRRFLVKRGDNYVITISMPNYYKFVDQGVKGAESTKPNTQGSPFMFRNKRPPISAIRQFMRNRQVVPRYNGKKQNSESARNRLAWAISEGIRRRGVEAVPFYSDIVNPAMVEDLARRLADVFGQDIIDKIDID